MKDSDITSIRVSKTFRDRLKTMTFKSESPEDAILRLIKAKNGKF